MSTTPRPETPAGREILASQRRVIEQIREMAFPHMVGEPVEQEAITALVVLCEAEARAIPLLDARARLQSKRGFPVVVSDTLTRWQPDPSGAYVGFEDAVDALSGASREEEGA